MVLEVDTPTTVVVTAPSPETPESDMYQFMGGLVVMFDPSQIKKGVDDNTSLRSLMFREYVTERLADFVQWIEIIDEMGLNYDTLGSVKEIKKRGGYCEIEHNATKIHTSGKNISEAKKYLYAALEMLIPRWEENIASKQNGEKSKLSDLAKKYADLITNQALVSYDLSQKI